MPINKKPYIRLLITPSCNAAWNMAVDETIFEQVKNGRTPATLRLYSWEPCAVSLGYGQSPEDELDMARCRDAGVDIVRRPTGGKAVFHDREITYALAAPEKHPAFGASPLDTYRRVSGCLVQALESFDLHGDLVQDADPESQDAGACFSRTARYEIRLFGRKLAGSAQRRARGFLLQHGSLLLGPGHRRLALFLPSTRTEQREEMMDALNRRTISLSEALGRPVYFREMAPLLADAFAACLGAHIEEQTLSPEETDGAQRLVRVKYGNPDWTYHRKTDYGF